jgi:hypothetical protein
MTATSIINRPLEHDEAKVLAHYAAGETSRQIVAKTGMTMDDVGYILDALAGNSRERATALVLEYRDQIKTSKPAKSTAGDAPARSAAPKPVAAVQPDITAVEPEPEEPSESIDGVVELLDAAAATGEDDLVERAEAIRGLIRDLQTLLHEHAKMRAEVRAALVDEARRLESRLAEIRARLEALGGETA